MADTTTAALVGAAGGAGTTRLCVELAATLAHGGRDVAVLDAAFATQGLADYLPGRLDPDLTALLTDDADAALATGLADLRVDAPGRVACCPARAPFERLARAKTAGAARRFEERIDEAADRFDHVLVDTPPVAANQAIAAVTATDRVVLVAPPGARGADAVARGRDRLADLDVSVDGVVAARGGTDPADVSVPAFDASPPADAPDCADVEEPVSRALVRAAALVVDAPVEPAFASRSLLESVGDRWR